VTPQEWQEAVNAACLMRNVADCMMYGLLTGPAVDVARCDDLLERGAALGIHPEPALVEASLKSLWQRLLLRADNRQLATGNSRGRRP